MRVASPATQATAALKQITAAANKSPTKPINLSLTVFNALASKLEKLAKTDAPKASGLVDLMEELHGKGLIAIAGNAGPLPFAAANAWKSGMNSIKEVLNNNAAAFDDKPTLPLVK